MAKGVDRINGLSPQEYAFRSPIVSRQDGGVYWSDGVKWNKLASDEDMSEINDTLLLILAAVNPNATEAKQDIQITEQTDQGLTLDAIATNTGESFGLESTVNSTVTPLGIGATFTGTWEDIIDFASVQVLALFDEDSADSGVLFQFSGDGVNLDRSIPKTLLVASNPPTTLARLGRYFRIVWTNGGVAQTVFRLTTTYHRAQTQGLIARKDTVIGESSDILAVRNVSDIDLDVSRNLNDEQSTSFKFGGSQAVTSSSNWSDLWGPGTAYNWLTAAATIRIKAGGSANDAAAGSHARTLDCIGLNTSWEEEAFTLTFNGVLASTASPNSYFRLLRAKVQSVGTYGNTNDATVDIETSGGTLLAEILAGEGQTRLLIYTVPLGHTLFIDHIEIEVGASKSADVRIAFREGADDTVTPMAIRTIPIAEDHLSGREFHLSYEQPFTEKTDVWVQAKLHSGSGTTSVFGHWVGRLVKD